MHKNMVTLNNFVSITDIRQNATTYINDLERSWDKIIFRNNKPTAVLVDFGRYERLTNNLSNIEELDWSNEVIWTKNHNDFISLLKNA